MLSFTQGTVSAVATIILLSTLTVTASESSADALESDASLLGAAVVTDPGSLLGAVTTIAPPAGRTAVVDGRATAGFPTDGQRYLVMSTGEAESLHAPNLSGSTSATLGGSARGALDVTTLRLDLQVPPDANCLTGINFRFLSEEYPEFVGTSFNDAFIAELDESTWSVSGSDVVAPDNFAFDPGGNPFSINAAGVTSMNADEATGTTFDGATPLLSAATPITPGPHSLFLSIFDAGDAALDSAVMVDNLRFGRVSDVERDCRPGAQLAAGEFVALGDSYSSGFGNAPYEPGTNRDDGPNDCQRSPQAWGPLVADKVGLDLSFHACQGAVTRDFYYPRSDREDEDWGEVPQLDHLDADTALVTLSAGGNDAQFADIYSECVLGFELLPWNTCSGESKVNDPLEASLARLDGGPAGDDDRLRQITPYQTLFGSIRNRTPYATRVVSGYPPFFPRTGADTLTRCQGIKRADQRWIFERTLEMNRIIEENAGRNGFRYADPASRFSGHEFCGTRQDDWFHGITHPGKVHPTVAGHEAMAEAAMAAIDTDDRPRFLVRPQQTVTTTTTVDRPLGLLSLFLEWPGSDIPLSVTSPSGTTYSRSTPRDALQENGPTWDHLEIEDPEQGVWTVTMYGADVDPQGEEAVLTVTEVDPPNAAPVARMVLGRNGDRLTLDASGSTDTDGRIVGYDWYVDLPDADLTASGARASVKVPLGRPVAVTLAVRDDRGHTTFLSRNLAPLDVIPASINTKSNGVTPMRLIGGEGFDAGKVRPETLRVGPAGATVRPQHAKVHDRDRQGNADLTLQVSTPGMGLRPGATSVCLTGLLTDGMEFSACDGVTVK